MDVARVADGDQAQNAPWVGLPPPRIRSYKAFASVERELSQLQFCYLISLDQEPGTRFDPANARVLTNFLIGNTVQNIRNHQDRIEGALVDRALWEHMQ